jgi:ubiquinone/menaquinone biosynthesis C-methylase UbiE
MTTAGRALLDPHKIFAHVGLTKGMRIADFGCGRTGHFVFSAARVVGETGVVYAVDIVKEVLEHIGSRIRTEGYDNVQTIWSDIESFGKTAIPEKSLDGCFLVNVLFLSKHKKEVIAEAVRLLKKGGFLVIVDWLQKIGPCGPAPEAVVSPEEARTLLVKSGLDTVQQIALGEYNYCLIARKI